MTNTILIDHRERNIEIIKELEKDKIPFEITSLNNADFVINNIGIERKSVAGDTPVVIKFKNNIKILEIKEAFKFFKEGNKISVMGLNFRNTKIDWFPVYEVSRHKSRSLFYVSTSPKIDKKYKNEESYNIEITGGHNIHVFRKKKILCIPTKELKIGDYILLVPPKLENSRVKLYSTFKNFLEQVQSDSIKNYKLYKNNFKLGSASSDYKIPKLDEDFYFILGLWVADGKYGAKTLEFSQKDKRRNSIIEKYLEKVFGNFKRVSDFYIAGGKTYFLLYKDILKLQSGSSNKKIPQIVFNSKKSLIAAFIRGYFFGDGFKNGDKKRRNPQLLVCSKSKELIVGLSYLLFSLGIENSVVPEYKTYKNERRKYFLLRVKTISLQNFIKNIGQIPTKEITIKKCVSTKIPFYFGLNVYRSIKRLRENELIYLYKATLKIKNRQLKDIDKDKFISIVNKLNLRIKNKYKTKEIQTIYKHIFKKIENKIGLDTLFLISKIYKNEIFLQRVYNVKGLNKERVVYDFSVKSSENFVGGLTPILLHNTKFDFLNSIADKRIITQIKGLKESFEKPLIIIEGQENIYSIRDFHPNSIRGMISSIIIDNNIPIIYTESPRDTASFLKIIHSRQEKDKREVSLINKRTFFDIPKQQEFIIQSLPGIGPNLSKALLKEFKTIEAVINAEEKDLMVVDKIGKIKAKNIKNILNTLYKEDL